jgi:hypothetical protein
VDREGEARGKKKRGVQERRGKDPGFLENYPKILENI